MIEQQQDYYSYHNRFNAPRKRNTIHTESISWNSKICKNGRDVTKTAKKANFMDKFNQ